MKKEDLVRASTEIRKTADRLIKSKGIVSVLSEFGEVVFTGSYKYNLMLDTDIDLYVVRDKKYSYEGVLNIFNKIVLQKKFRSYFIAGDWNDIRKGKTFPKGYYMGIKEKYNDQTWKFDIWFIDRKELKRLQKQEPGEVNEKQRELILKIKDYKNKNKLKLLGLEIYQNVLSGKWNSIKDVS